jgi:hypothetical protein
LYSQAVKGVNLKPGMLGLNDMNYDDSEVTIDSYDDDDEYNEFTATYPDTAEGRIKIPLQVLDMMEEISLKEIDLARSAAYIFGHVQQKYDEEDNANDPRIELTMSTFYDRKSR